MRIGSTVLLFNQVCVQSYGWKDFRPLGSLQGVIDSLEEYQCDEVAVIRPVRLNDNLEQFRKDLLMLKSLKTMTPVSFGGGIRSVEHLKLLNDLPIERLIFSSAFLEKDTTLLTMARDLFGHQAIQCLLPIVSRSEGMCIFHSSKSRYVLVEELDFFYISSFANEIIIFDIENEGKKDSFNWTLMDSFPFTRDKLIISGGIGMRCTNQAYKNQIASVLVDNKVLHREYSISGFKNATVLS